MALKAGTQFFQVQLLRPLHKENGVGIAHGHRGNLPHTPSRCQLHGCPYLWAAHIDPDRLYHPVLRQQLQGTQPAAGLDGQVLFMGQALIVDVFAQAADAVAAHRPF